MIGSKIMAIRNKNQLTQKEFAKRTGISYGTLQAYEYGTQYPRYDYLMKLSDMFNVSMLFFLDNSKACWFSLKTFQLAWFIDSVFNFRHLQLILMQFPNYFPLFQDLYDDFLELPFHYLIIK